MEPILTVKEGCFSYPGKQPLLKNINLSLNGGQVMAVMGKNGSGKTTLLQCIVGILNWSSGYCSVNGTRGKKNKPFKEIGYVPQAHKASFSYTVRDMVVFGKTGRNSYFAAPVRCDYELADQTLEKVGIYHLRNQPCNELSGGQLQLVFIARALIHSPRLLVLDEPESYLDFCNQLRLLKLIQSVVADHSIACMLNTHYPNHAARLADQCFLLGTDDYTVGDTKDVMTSQNIQKYFGVTTHSAKYQYKGETITTFSFLDEV